MKMEFSLMAKIDVTARLVVNVKPCLQKSSQNFSCSDTRKFWLYASTASLSCAVSPSTGIGSFAFLSPSM
jgi:hypothetical protein